jgi:hypothetical protein
MPAENQPTQRREFTPGPIAVRAPVRSRLRRWLYKWLDRAFAPDDGKAVLAKSLHGAFSPNRALLPKARLPEPPPYAELGQPVTAATSSDRSDVIIITARFRSGSTLLWNLFRHLDGFTSYYEPFNERRWFDPATRGRQTDPSHRLAEEYWREYDGLPGLAEHFRDEWVHRHLYMDAAAWDPGMKRYVELLIEQAPGRPVLQFNRIDFRLPWLRKNFPNALLVHLYRHPRDQWCSALMDIKCFRKDAPPADFGWHDKFYLLSWARDLRYQFPFLDDSAVTHPYQLFYYVWKLSYLFGRAFGDHSFAFEDLVSRPTETLGDLFRKADITERDIQKLLPLIERPALGKWRDYADDAWFRRHESICETTLAEFGLGPTSPAA